MRHQDVVRSIFASVNLGEPASYKGFKLFPMYPKSAPSVSMLTARAAVESGLARIEELPTGPSVRALRLCNGAPLPVLVRDGDLFVSGRQDRIADRPMLVPAGAEVELPVSCVEHNRWAPRDRADFSVWNGSADAALRHERMASARTLGAPDQQSTWNAVATRRSSRGLSDAGGSLIEAERELAPTIEAAVEALSPVYGASGLVLCASSEKGARVALVEWFADPTACADAWRGSVRGAVSGIAAKTHAPTISRTEIRTRFAALSRAPGASADDGVRGAVHSFEHGRTQGLALTHAGAPVHLVAVHA